MLSIPLLFFGVGLLFIFLNLRSKFGKKKALTQTAMMLGLQFSDGMNLFDTQITEALQKTGSNEKMPEFMKNPANVSRLRKIFSIFAPWEMTGRINGVPVRVYETTRGTDENSRANTRFEAKFSRSLNLGLMITSESVFSKIGQVLFNKKDIQTGNPELDNLLKIHGDSDEKIRLLLSNYEIQQALLEAYKTHPSIVITDEAISVDYNGVITDTEKFKSTLEALSRVYLPLERALRFQ